MPRLSRLRQKVEAVQALCGRHMFQGVAFLATDPAQAPRPGAGYCDFCRACLSDPACLANCRHTILSGAYQSLRTGEPYFGVCWLGLNTVVVPVAPSGQLVGALELGAFSFSEGAGEDQAYVRARLESQRLHANPQLLARLSQIRPATSGEVRQAAAFVFEALFSNGVNDVQEFRRRHENYLLQRSLAETIHEYGQQRRPLTEVLNLLPLMQAGIRRKDRAGTLLLLNEFLCSSLLHSGSDVTRLKADVHLLLSLLTREQVVNGAEAGRAVLEQFHTFRELDAIAELEEVCYWTLQRVRRVFSDGDNPLAPSRSLGLSERVLAWLQENFWKPVHLADAAGAAGTSESTLRQTLKRETGRTFVQHLHRIRIAEAKYLLATTDLTVDQVARNCGYYDQSHFCRRFRSECGLTPLEFRRLEGAQPSP